MDDHALTDSILIVDFGSQVTQLIARRVREAGVYSEIAPFNNAEAAFARMQPKGIILSGGPASTTQAGSPRAPQIVFDSGLPILGICYGQQTMMMQLGADGVFVGSGIFKSGDPIKRAEAIVQATRHYDNPDIVAKVSRGLGEAMVGINVDEIPQPHRLAERGWAVGNADVTVVCERPKVAAHAPAMRANLAADLGIAVDAVSVKATTSEKLGFTGRGEGIAAQAVVLLVAA